MHQDKIQQLQYVFEQNELTNEDVHLFTNWYQKYTNNMLDRTSLDDIQERLVHYFDLFTKYGKKPSDFITLFRKKSAIILREVQTIETNIQKNAQLLKLTPQTILEMSLKQPPFLLGSPQKHKDNANKLADIFQTNVETIIQVAIKQPQLLCHSPKEIENKYQLYKRCYFNGIFTLNNDTPKDRFIMKKAFHQKNETVLQHYEQKLIQRLLNDPTLLFIGVDNIRIKMGYARFLQSQGKNSTSEAIRKSKKQIQETLEHAPDTFKNQNKPTYRLLNLSLNTKE